MNRVCAGFAICLLAVGCNREPKSYNVSGTVTWEDGTPLKAGLVFFDPAPDTDGPQGSATVRDGNFSTADGHKVAAGKYVVRIEGYSGQGVGESPMGKLLFNDFQQAIELPASDSVQHFEVPRKDKKKAAD